MQRTNRCTNGPSAYRICSAGIVTVRDPYPVEDFTSKDGFEPPTVRVYQTFQPWPLGDLLDWFSNNIIHMFCIIRKPTAGFAPATYSLQRSCTTVVLCRQVAIASTADHRRVIPHHKSVAMNAFVSNVQVISLSVDGRRWHSEHRRSSDLARCAISRSSPHLPFQPESVYNLRQTIYSRLPPKSLSALHIALQPIR